MTIPMIQRRRIVRSILLAAALCAAVVALRFPSFADAQQPAMDRSGVLDIRSEDEKRIFATLQCTCGCPRESIASCTCGSAHNFRIEVRAMMAKGMSHEDIKAEWVRQHGTGAMMVPSNEGANRFLYILPLLMIAGMAAFAVTVLRRFRRGGVKAEARAAAATKPKGSGADAYDEKLDDELKKLDDQNDE
jgi:cytochrome c-type biogenesis protein CcmH